MRLHHPNGGESIQTRSRLVWVDDQSNAAYAGATFLDAVSFEGTFLAMLMSRSNRHHNNARGLSGPEARPRLWGP